MPRSGQEARRRLQQAALELFQQQGYEATTAADIAQRAGVTERTFFRHFTDKREILFDGHEAFRDALAEAVAACPRRLGPMKALLQAFRSVEPLLRQNRPFSEPRHRIVAQTPALQERMLAKTAALTTALAAALHQRGLDESLATLAAQVGMAAFGHAVRAWLAAPDTELETHLTRAFADVQRLSASSGRGGR